MAYESTIVITGGTTGLGYEAAWAIAKAKPQVLVVVASRSPGGDAAGAINRSTGLSNVVYIPLDLSSIASIRKFADTLAKDGNQRISALLLNAGLQIPDGFKYTAEGIEMTFGVNHVGHALLFHLLAWQFMPETRIVLTSSGTHDPAQKTGLPNARYTQAEALAHPSKESLTENTGRQRYATSKLVNVLWMYAVDQRRAELGKRWTINAFDPGLMPGTGLARDAGRVTKFLWLHVLPKIIPILRLFVSPNIHSVQESGQVLARLVIGHDVARTSGRYFEGPREIRSSIDSYSKANQGDIWRWTIDFIGSNERERERFEKLA